MNVSSRDNKEPTMLGHLKRLVPRRMRTAARVALKLRRLRKPLLTQILRKVCVPSLLETLASIEDDGGAQASPLVIKLRGIKHPLTMRRRTSDFDVFRQVILGDQYVLPVDEPVEFIVDAGANIGLASVSFLEQFPRARVLAIEPDPANFAIATQNLKNYGERCTLVNAALWSEEGTLAISRGTYRDGREWATQMVPVTDQTDVVVPARTLPSLLREHAFHRVDILKIDIEGAELEVFRDGDTSFLSATRCCAVECHGDACVKALSDAATREGFLLSESGELMLALRPQSSQTNAEKSGIALAVGQPAAEHG